MDKNQQLDEIVTESINRFVTEMTTEVSRNAKRRNEKDVRDALTKGKGGYNAVKCFAVFTAQNSDSTQQSAKDNKKANHSLLSDLKRGNYIVVPTEGKFENLENSYCVINISIEAVKYFCGKYEQSSFIYTTIGNNMDIRNHYYEKADITMPYDKEENDYICKDCTSDCIEVADADDYYTKVGKFKFSIPFSLFENISSQINSNLDAMLLYEGHKPSLKGRNALLGFATDRVGLTPYLYRQSAYRGLV